MENPDKQSAIIKAREIIESLFIEDASDIDVVAIATIRGAFVKEGLLKNAEGRLIVLGSNGLITVKSSIPEHGKKRFIIAHELGHFELHRTKTPVISCSDFDMYQWGKNKAIEVEANYFAAELLMPESIFKKKIYKKTLTKELIESLAQEFQTSLTATSIRFATIIRKYALICSENSKIKWFMANDFPYRLNVSGKVHTESMAYNFFQGKKLSETLLPVSPFAWIDDCFDAMRVVLEIAIPLPSYNQVLSLICIDHAKNY